jgi:hypothetical protein
VLLRWTLAELLQIHLVGVVALATVVPGRESEQSGYLRSMASKDDETAVVVTVVSEHVDERGPRK